MGGLDLHATQVDVEVAVSFRVEPADKAGIVGTIISLCRLDETQGPRFRQSADSWRGVQSPDKLAYGSREK